MIALAVALPLLGAALLALFGSRAGRGLVGAVGVGSVLAALAVVIVSVSAGPERQLLWTWFTVAELPVRVALRLDALSATFALVITGVGALIHLYAVDYMRDEPDLARFFAWMNGFVAAMLTLVLADDLLLLYAGWEGVGLCSYGLIGFWYREPANGRAARKAFVVTRAGDAALLLGLLTVASTLGTLSIPEVLELGPALWTGATATAVALLLLGGAVGKSAQLPLHVWLPDAMAGPTPVSALIHAATMVTAGVYLLARTFPLFLAAPAVLDGVAWLGAATMLVGAIAALGQTDLKRILAYSTMSQVGLMFVGLGAGSVAAAVFHFVTHAFFKALLFLGAGVVILASDHEQDVTRLGGLWRRLPLTFATFLVASAALAGLPLVTAGFYSKELVLAATPTVSWWLYGVSLLGALLTALYIFRAVFRVFFGPLGVEPVRRPRWQATVPMVALAILSIVGGFFPLEPEAHGEGAGLATALAASAASIVGIVAAWFVARGRARRGVPPVLDVVYDRLLVRPYVALGRWNRDDRLDLPYRGLAALAVAGHRALARTQTGRVRDYLAMIAVGAVLLLTLALWSRP